MLLQSITAFVTMNRVIIPGKFMSYFLNMLIIINILYNVTAFNFVFCCVMYLFFTASIEFS